MAPRVKICGLSTPKAVAAAIDGGAAYVGFVFFPGSPRDISPELAAALVWPARAAGVQVVAVTVDASDALIDAIQGALEPDFHQLHGGEPPARVAAVRARTGAGVIRAFRVGETADLDAAAAFEGVADQLMFDARPPKGAALPGGNGAAFDWSILQGRTFAKPWFLAGGLDAENVVRAVAGSGARQLDVSSGVESAPGVKDPASIRAFLEAVRRA